MTYARMERLFFGKYCRGPLYRLCIGERPVGCRMLQAALRRLQPTPRVSRASEPSTHVLTPPYIGALWGVARDNIYTSQGPVLKAFTGYKVWIWAQFVY